MTIGNIAKPNEICDYSRLEFKSETGEALGQNLKLEGSGEDQSLLRPLTEDMLDENGKKFEKLEEVSKKISMKCKSGYIDQVSNFGFLYMLDHNTSSFSHPTSQCHKINQKVYKKKSENPWAEDAFN